VQRIVAAVLDRRGDVTAAVDSSFTDRMSDEYDANANNGGAWPMPSPEVLRELDPLAPEWDEPDWPASPPSRRPARG
jgi:hypothetical protein